MTRPYVEFRNKRLGHKIDYDGAYGYQCTDLIKQYLDECLGRGKQKALGNANQIPASLEKMGFVKLGVNNIMQGDIIVRTKGSLGHIAIVDRILGNSVAVLEQNGSGKNSGDGEGQNAIRIKHYTINWFQVILRNNDIIKNFNKELKFVNEKLDERERSLKLTIDYKNALTFKSNN